MGFEGEIKGAPAFLSWENDIIPPGLCQNKPLLDGLWIVTAFQANKKLSESGILHFFQVSGRPAGSGSELRWRKACTECKGFFLFLKNLKKKKKNPRERHMRFSLFTSKIFSQTRNAFINSTKGVSELDSHPLSWMIRNVISLLWLFPSCTRACACVCACVCVC